MIITSTNQINRSHGVKVLLYGKSGVGKTSTAKTCPDPLIISAEKGLLCLQGVDIPVIEIANQANLVEVYNWLKSSQESKKYQTVFIDTITEVGEVVLSRTKAVVKDPRQAYGQLSDSMISMIKDFRDLPNRHVVMIAKQELIKDSIGVIATGAGMPGNKLGPALPYLFDEVFHMGVGLLPDQTTYRYFRTSADELSEAKDRSGKLAEIEPPDFSHIFKKISS